MLAQIGCALAITCSRVTFMLCDSAACSWRTGTIWSTVPRVSHPHSQRTTNCFAGSDPITMRRIGGMAFDWHNSNGCEVTRGYAGCRQRSKVWLSVLVNEADHAVAAIRHGKMCNLGEPEARPDGLPGNG